VSEVSRDTSLIPKKPRSTTSANRSPQREDSTEPAQRREPIPAAQPASSAIFAGERSYRASVARSTRASSALNNGPRPLTTAPPSVRRRSPWRHHARHVARAGAVALPTARHAPATTATPLASRTRPPAAPAPRATAGPSTAPESGISPTLPSDRRQRTTVSPDAASVLQPSTSNSTPPSFPGASISRTRSSKESTT